MARDDDVDAMGPTVVPPSGDAPTDVATSSGPRSEDPDTWLGNVLADRYRIERRLGSGGMGAVYAGTHLLLGKPVAIKMIKPRLGDDRGIAQRFVQEARAASGIAHVNVVHITDFGETPGGTAFLVMEHLDGEDLAETLAREGPLPWRRVVHIAEQIARALAAAHRQGIVHRDIKPANCYRLTRDDDADFVKVLDFGLAKVIGPGRDGEDSLTQTGALLGTPGYIAPEIYHGLRTDHRVDIYALGAVMYKLLTGELPPMRFADGEPSGVAMIPVPPALQAILRRCLADDPAARYPSAQALAADLKELNAGPRGALDLGSDAPTTAPLSSGSKMLAVSRDGHRISFTVGVPLLAAVVVSIGLAVYFGLRPDPAPDVPPAEPAPLPVAVSAPPPAPEPAAPPRDPAPPPVDADAPLDPPPAPERSDMPPSLDPPRPPGSRAALQRLINQSRCRSSFAYEVRVQWTADAGGRLDPTTFKARDPLGGDLNDSQSCAARLIKASDLGWTPDAPYKLTFKIPASTN